MDVRTAPAPVVTVRPADPDAPLVTEALADPRAFLELYDRYFDRVLGYVRLRVRDAATCEDVTSQVFATALAQLPRFRGSGTFGGWLFQIARNAVHDLARRPLLEPLAPSLPADDLDLDRRLDEQARAARLRPLIASLARDQQHLLALRYGAGLSFDEIAAVTGVPAGTARVRLHRLLHDLRKRYSDDD
jgi:RNA polymerase sigma-70 factor (ECF subfamily)